MIRGDVIALDVETTGLNPYHRGVWPDGSPMHGRIFCWAYITNKGEYGFMLKTPETIEWVRRLFNDPTKTIVFHNAKFDLKMFGFEGIDIFNIKATIDCTLILAKMYNGQMWDYDLRFLSISILNRSTADKDEVIDWIKSNSRAFVKQHGRPPGFHDAPVEIVKRRALWDVESTLQLHAFFKPRVMNSCRTLYETERQLMFVCIDMENTGVKVDITRAKKLKAEAERGIRILQKLLDDLVCPLIISKAVCPECGKVMKNPVLKDDRGRLPTYCMKCEKSAEPEIKLQTIERDFNPGSTAVQLPAAFEKMGITLLYKTKPKKGKKGKQGSGGGRWSFDEYAMIRYVSQPVASLIRDSGEEGWLFDRWWSELRRVFKENKLPRAQMLPPLVLKMNELSKMVSTYYDHIISDAVDVHTEPNGREVGILHCKFNQSEAQTGRFSSSEPNMQNMPRILGPRECFVPRQGRRNWHFDYEQVEMKFFVHFAKDKDMAKAIESDIHLYVAAEIYQKPAEQVTKEQRKRAKGVNFGIIYGSGANTMSETLTKKGLLTTRAEAAQLVGAYHRRFPSVRRTTNDLKIELHRKGYVTNPFGRRYHIPTKFGYKALNYECQGTSADLMKAAMVKIWKWLRSQGLKSKILLQVHDELAIEIPPSEQAVVVPKIIELMQDLKSYFVPITVDAEVVTERWSKKDKPEKAGLTLKAA